MSTDSQKVSSSFVAQMDGVYFRYDGARMVLHGVSMALERGQAYALVGPNGAGKSTIVGLLTGSLEPTVGRVVLEGRTEAIERRARTATVQQQLSLFPHLTVAENLLLGLQHLPIGIRARKSAHELTRGLLGAIGANLSLDAPCGSLPFAARQKIEIARALARRPTVLCLDEPTSALDSVAKEELCGALHRIRATGTTVVLVTHDSREVSEVGATPIYVSEGRIVEHLERSAAPVNGAASHDPAHEIGAPAFEVRVTNHLRGAASTFSVAPGLVTLAIFDDALERSESVQSFLGTGGNVFASVRTGTSEPWKRLPDRSLAGKIRIVSGSKHEYNVFPSLTTQENAVLLAAGKTRPTFRSAQAESHLLDALRQRIAIEYPSRHSRFTALSGGNQQRLILAAAMESDPDLLVVEEPLMGVDERSIESIAGSLWNYATGGRRVLIATCFPDTYRHWNAKRVKLPVAASGNGEETDDHA